MWCAICKKDVAAELLGGDDPRCSYCGTTISPGLSARPRTRTQKARDLLEKWSQPQPVVPTSAEASHSTPSEPNGKSTTGKESAHLAPESMPNAETEESAKRILPVFRFDQPHPNQALAKNELESDEEPNRDREPSNIEVEKTNSTETSPPAKLERRDLKFHSTHLEFPAPHFHIPNKSEFLEESTESSMTILAGYMLSYLGVLGLLTGTVLVVIGYFKGPPNYMPMGWIINAFGQLLLYLGIVTLVSNKMDRMKSSLISEFHYIREQYRPHTTSAADELESSSNTFDKTDQAA